MSRILQVCVTHLAMVGLAAIPSAARDVAVPEPLQPWKAWVLAGHPEHACPLDPAETPVCVTHGSLVLDLGDRGGAFVQTVTVFGEQWVTLSGDGNLWPKEVRRVGADVPVVLWNGKPGVRLPHGEHRLTGTFTWSELPTALPVPEGTALFSLRLRGVRIPAERDGSNRLLLESRAKADTAKEEAVSSLRVFRRWADEIPMRLETVIRISASGQEREILTGRVLPPGTTPLSQESSLPMRVESDGRLRVQVQPGDHVLRLNSRFLELAPSLAMERMDSLWPAEEIWTFEAHPELRTVELSGADLIDPSQTGLPPEWKNLPAYLLMPGDTLRLTEKQRGNPGSQAGTLRLRREVWVDFSGRGYTLKDNIQGELRRRMRLEMRPGFDLGRVELAGASAMLTVSSQAVGVEVPAGPLHVTALSRSAGSREATGWNQVFNSVEAALHLPPGWKLLHARGPDRISDSWIADWSLWDVFLLCILTLAVLRLAGWSAAGLALLAFGLLSQEAGLPGLFWLNLLAALGLCKVLPQGKLRTVLHAYRMLAFALLALAWIPFAITHARMALYPQLDGPESGLFGLANAGLENYGAADKILTQMVTESEPVMAMAPPPKFEEDQSVSKPKTRLGGRRGRGSYSDIVLDESNSRFKYQTQYGKVQTGPGEPAWNWASAHLSWSGPVQEGEDLRLFLLRPWATRICRALQALLPGLLLLLLAFAPGTGWKIPAFGLRRPGLGIWILLALASARADIPSDSILKELESRLLAPPVCAPRCAELNSAAVTLRDGRLRLELRYDAIDTAVAVLPQAGSGQLDLVLILAGGRPAASALRLNDGRLALALARGRHSVVLEGRLTGSRLELAFGESARNISVTAPGYSVQGLSGERAEAGTLVFQSLGGSVLGKAAKKAALLPEPIRPYVEVQRRLRLDEEWTLETRVLRIAPDAGSFAVEVPLMPFERPVTNGLSVTNGKVLIGFAETAGEVTWKSVVARQESLRFSADGVAERSEMWQVDASPRWHLETSGPASIEVPNSNEEASWRPRPGDTLRISISEPAAARGSVKTVESVSLSYTPGRREGSARLELRIRAGQGDATEIALPADATLEQFSIDGNTQPLGLRGGKVTIPLHPGVQDVTLAWKLPLGMRPFVGTPQVKLGESPVNVSLALNVPGDRWVLWVFGPTAGPALLLWGVLLVMLLLAYGLAKAKVTPLGFMDWALLFAGTSTVNVYATGPLLVLFLALRSRERHAGAWKRSTHNGNQLVLAVLGVFAFGMVVGAVPEGLLSTPDMQVIGNGSSSHLLRWFQDRVSGNFPRGVLFSLPLWIYRLAMLAWSLWLAFRLLGWLRWCWEKYSAGGIWKPKILPQGPLTGV